MTPACHFLSGHIVYRYLRVINQIFSSPHLACDNMLKHKCQIIPNIYYTYLTQRCIVHIFIQIISFKLKYLYILNTNYTYIQIIMRVFREIKKNNSNYKGTRSNTRYLCILNNITILNLQHLI